MRAYGDRLDDGLVQLSFTLPMVAGPLAREAAREYAARLGLERIHVAWMEAMGTDFTFFVVTGSSPVSVDTARLKVEKPSVPEWTPAEIETVVREKIGRPLVIVGACVGHDAHTVGIDAILSLKGFAGDKGLESYHAFRVHNLGSQVAGDNLVKEIVRRKADALLVSRLVTQQDEHIQELERLAALLKGARGVPSSLVTCVGGPRIDQRLASRLGFDGGFGMGTRPREVAGFIVQTFLNKKGEGRGEKGSAGRVEGPLAPSARKGRRPLFWRFSSRRQGP